MRNQEVRDLLENYLTDKQTTVDIVVYTPSKKYYYTGDGNGIQEQILDLEVENWFTCDDGSIEIQVRGER